MEVAVAAGQCFRRRSKAGTQRAKDGLSGLVVVAAKAHVICTDALVSWRGSAWYGAVLVPFWSGSVRERERRPAGDDPPVAAGEVHEMKT